MNIIERKALTVIKEKAKNFQKKKQDIYSLLLQNPTYKSLCENEATLKITISKSQFENENCENDIKKLKKLTAKKSVFEQEYSEVLFKEYNCLLCSDTGFRGNIVCSCLNKVISEMLLSESGLQIKTLPDFQKSDFDIFENKEEMKKLYKTFELWLDKKNNSPVVNWGLFGFTGTGKTHLMLCAANALIERGNYIYFTSAFKMSVELLKEHQDFEDTSRDYISKYTDCDVLFIDDLGTEPLYNNVSENYMYLILNQRMLDNKPVIFSTNLDLEDLRERYGERIFSRLVNKNKTKSLWFGGKDFRMVKK